MIIALQFPAVKTQLAYISTKDKEENELTCLFLKGTKSDLSYSGPKCVLSVKLSSSLS